MLGGLKSNANFSGMNPLGGPLLAFVFPFSFSLTEGFSFSSLNISYITLI
jgi:hypothetical protein